jgi:hypothetical protein
MKKIQLAFVGVMFTAVAALPLSAQQAAGGRTPTVKNPLRFSAFAVQIENGLSGVLEIAIERWSTPQERDMLVGLIKTSTNNVGGQSKLLKAVDDIKPRVGYVSTQNSLGWDLKYAWQAMLPDGTRQIVIGTDKPIGFARMVGSGGDTTNFPFDLVEIQFPKGSEKGTGKLITQTSITMKNGRLELALYNDVNKPARLTEVVEHK